MKRSYLISMIGLLSTSSLLASDPMACTQLNDDKQRLACYDAIFKSKAQIKATPPKPVTPAESPIRRMPPAATANPPAPVSKPSPQVQAANDEDIFGMEHKIARAAPTAISSVAVGSFTNWKKKMLIKLENGQQWKIVGSKSMYHKVTNPNVTIEKGAFGAFYMGIEGINGRIKVRRVK
ncbi:hypothetical protein [Pleionea sp. CnH1-48]|uniref:hypothetical protein n=1 Tax=Pleionea sp. CnH1-48 TaxID=2954494 RepID=UPI00209788AA|nr:hypothetical protein [Pleionea sp. CnH1-48]MCO7223058.1 hypothetical protein [Pleionea sp. CnH1-48]